MPKYLSPIDLNGNELQNVKLQNLASDPSLGASDGGRFWFNTSTKLVKGWDGSAVQNLTNLLESVAGGTHVTATPTGKTTTITVDATDANTPSTMVSRDASGNFSAGTITAALTGTASNSTTLGGQTLAQVRDFSQTTGQRTATSAISNFDTQVRTSRLDQMAAPTASVPLNSQKITGLADPTSPQDAATKNYVDSVVTGLDIKASVKAGTIAALPTNVYANGASGVGATLTGSANGALTNLDTTYAPTVGDRILVKNEATQANNGIYVITQVGSAGAPYILTRATDADTSAEVSGGMFAFVEGGQTLAGTGWTLNGTGVFTIGSTAQVFSQFTGGASYAAGNGLSLTGNVFAVVGTANRVSVSASGVDIAATYVGQTSITTLGTIATGTWSATTIALNKGGTGATTAAAARTNLAVPGKYSADLPAIGAGASQAVTHNLGTTDISSVSIKEASTGALLGGVDVVVTDANTVTVTVATAIANAAYRITVTA